MIVFILIYLICVITGGGASLLAQRIYKLASTDLKDILSGIDYSILNEFIRVSKDINIFIWCSKEQIPELLNYFLQYNVFFEILCWCKTNPIPATQNTWLPDIEYCLYFREKGHKLNDGYDLKSKYHISQINKLDKDKFEHPTIKPINLVKRHLLHTTQPNDVVLDCFMGSGTTCVACKDIGRQYIGIEIEKKWYDIAKDRLNGIESNGQYCMFLS